MRLTTRLLKRLQRELNKIGLFVPVRQFECLQTIGKHRVLVIAPGSIPIPAIGWGAVETVISETLPQYMALESQVWLLNSRHFLDWNSARKLDFDLIVSHSDFHTLQIKKFWPETFSIGVSHYGYAAFSDKWDRKYDEILRNLSLHNKIVCLSQEVYSEYSNFIDSEKLVLSPNGSSFEPILDLDKNGIFICIGKVEERKRQFDLYKAFRAANKLIHFIGHIEDPRVKEELKKDSEARKYFIGPMTRIELAAQISRYKGLILISDGEGDALVLYEAQLAGLPILVSKPALGAQDPNLDWVQIISKDFSIRELEHSYERVKSTSQEISSYSRENYNWEKRNRTLISHCLKALSDFQ
jgi:glycosyltransferase involved in cell wall biosynthesis